MYTLGKTLRKRYGRLLPSDGFYTSDSMHAVSSNVERAQMSGQSLLAGFVPPLFSERDSKLQISWQPIPIHQIPKHLDNVCNTTFDVRIEIKRLHSPPFTDDQSR